MEILTMPSRYKVKTFTVSLRASDSVPPSELLSSPSSVASRSRDILGTLDGDQEHFLCWFLNVQNETKAFKHCNSGSVDQVAVYPRIIIRNALLIGAAGLILVHNHPSGHLTPSEEDRRLTSAISDASKLFDIRLLDHLIICQGVDGYFSFREKGLVI